MKEPFLSKPALAVHSVLMCFCITLGWQTISTANPSATDPEASLDVHATIPAAKELVEQLYALATEVERLGNEADKVRYKEPEREPIRELMRACGNIQKSLLDVQHLKQMGEPAGHDLDLRLSRLWVSVRAHAQIYGRTPPGQRLVAKQDLAARKLLPKFAKIAERAMKQALTGDVDGIDRMLGPVAAQMAENIAPLPTPYDKPFQNGYIDPLAAVMAKVAEVRTEQYRQASVKAMDKMVQAAQQFSTNSDAAINQFRQNASDPIATQTAASELLKQWALASTSLVRAHAVAHAFEFDRNGQSGGPLSTIDAASARLQQDATKAYVGLVTTAAEATDPSKISEVYGVLLTNISHVQRRSANGNAFLEACKPALAGLAEKSPAFQVQLAQYDRATQQPLGWRARFTEQSVKTIRQDYPELPEALPEYLADWANRVAAQTGPSVIGKSVSSKPALRLLMPKPFVATPISSSHYLNVYVAPETTSAIQDLKSALVVSEKYPPLSVESAHAVSSADSFDFEATGGKILGITLEPRLVRFADLPTAGYVLMPFGSTPTYRTDRYNPHAGICWRVDVQASWVQNKYFVVTAPN